MKKPTTTFILICFWTCLISEVNAFKIAIKESDSDIVPANWRKKPNDSVAATPLSDYFLSTAFQDLSKRLSLIDSINRP